MTPDELRRALERLTPAQFEDLNASVGTGGANTGIEGRVQHFVYFQDRPKLDEVYSFHLQRIAGIELATEAEKLAQAAMVSAAADTRSADAATRAADAAERSEKHAKSASRAAWYTVVLAVVAVIVTLALARGC
jgi:hypothetical protein